MLAFGEPTNSSLLRRKVGDISYGLYASPDFIAANGLPDEIESLNGQSGIVYLRNGIAERWVLQRRRKTVELKPYPRFNVNEYWMAKFFAVEGFAIGYLPDFFVKYEIDTGRLGADVFRLAFRQNTTLRDVSGTAAPQSAHYEAC